MAHNARSIIQGCLLVGLAIGAATQACAGAGAEPQDFSNLDLAALMNLDVTVTSVSKHEQRLADAASAVTLLSNDDLRRSGASSVAESLRLVPGMDVAQINSSTWAVSARGFDETFSRSLLVLVDGRAVFSPFDGSVYWDLQQQMLEDVDRIEVIRGPGGTLWGANAVNGVVNIVSKSARDTQGTYVYASAGDVQRTQDGVRYGGKIDDDTSYRVFGSFQANQHYTALDGSPAPDRWQGGTAGFRIDRYGSANSHTTLQGDFTRDRVLDSLQTNTNFNTVGRWSRTLTDRSDIELQFYFDRRQTQNAFAYNTSIDSMDLTAQQTVALGPKNRVVWGIGARLNHVELTPGLDPTQVRNGDFTVQLYSLFAQDEFQILPDKVTLTLGTKIDHNQLTGIEVQPNLRVLLKPSTDQTVWAAVSRAVIEPTYKQAVDAARSPGGPPDNGVYPSFIGNPQIRSSIELSYELGYRIQPTPRVSVELAGYVSRYSNLINQVPDGTTIAFPLGQIGVLRWENSYAARTYGGEANVTVTPIDTWRLIGTASMMHVSASGALVDDDAIGGSPARQFSLRSSNTLTRQVNLDVQVRFVSAVSRASSYITADLRVGYKPTDRLEFSLVGKNLLQPQHIELGTDQALSDQVPRGVYGRFTLRL